VARPLTRQALGVASRPQQEIGYSRSSFTRDPPKAALDSRPAPISSKSSGTLICPARNPQSAWLHPAPWRLECHHPWTRGFPDLAITNGSPLAASSTSRERLRPSPREYLRFSWSSAGRWACDPAIDVGKESAACLHSLVQLDRGLRPASDWTTRVFYRPCPARRSDATFVNSRSGRRERRPRCPEMTIPALHLGLSVTAPSPR